METHDTPEAADARTFEAFLASPSFETAHALMARKGQLTKLTTGSFFGDRRGARGWDREGRGDHGLRRKRDRQDPALPHALRLMPAVATHGWLWRNGAVHRRKGDLPALAAP